MTEESKTDRLAMNAIERIFLENGSHELEVPSRDYGRDGRLIFNVEGGAEGYSTSLQVKGTRSIDTERFCAFKFRCEVKTLLYLRQCQAPAYWVVHNCKSNTTYVREVHDLVNHLDASRPGWRRKSTVPVMLRQEMLLTPERIKRIAQEARAWAMERDTTWATVRAIERQVGRYASIRRNQSASFMWMSLRGGFNASSAADVMQMLLFMSNLMHGLTLCALYRQRMAKGLSPNDFASTAFGTLDLTDLTDRLNAVQQRHRALLARTRGVLLRTRPSPLPNTDWVPPKKRGLMGPNLDKLKSARRAAVAVARYLNRLGLVVNADAVDPLDLVVRCESALGLLSLGVFGAKVTRERTLKVRSRLRTLRGSAATILVRLSQGEHLERLSE
jgi:hypothetical protein